MLVLSNGVYAKVTFQCYLKLQFTKRCSILVNPFTRIYLHFSKVISPKLNQMGPKSVYKGTY